MARARTRGGADYIELRGSIYYAKFQYSDALRASVAKHLNITLPAENKFSLRTKDATEARMLAAPFIEEHHAFLLFHRAVEDKDTGTISMAKVMEPNTYEDRADGSRVLATESNIITTHNGKVETKPNAAMTKLVVKHAVAKNDPNFRALVATVKRRDEAAHRDTDAGVLTAYCESRGLRKDDQSGAEALLARFRAHVRNRPISQCSRADVAGFIEAECALRSVPRVKKMTAFVCAAINRDMRDTTRTRYKHNPFSQIEWPKHHAVKLVEFSDGDIDVMARALDGLPSDKERLMVAMHIATGVRPVGIYNIEEGKIEREKDVSGDGLVNGEHATQVVRIAKDKDATEQYGKRWIAVPQAVIDMGLLPSVFTGSRFTKRQATLLKNINDWLERIGVKTAINGKAFYSGRHRAASRFRAVGPPRGVAEHIMGHAHESGSSNDGYGGHRAYILKRWVDYVGFAPQRAQAKP